MADFSAYESLTVDGSSTPFTAATRGTRNRAFVTVEFAQVRFRMDGTDPTATVGHILNVDDVLELDSGQQLIDVRFIRTGGTSATLRCAYGS